MPTESGQGVQRRIVNVSAEQSVAVDSDLKKCIEGKNCIAFIGSGPSIKPYCDWVELVNWLCARCGVSEQVTEDTPKDKLPAIAEKARKADIDAYHSELGKIFGHIGMTNPLYDVLMRIPFKCYVTTNFDPLLSHEARKTEHKCRGVEAYPRSLNPANINHRTIFYIHGLIRENSTPAPGDIVLSQSEFDKAYGPNSSLLSFLKPLLVYNPICFIGCKLEEPLLKEVFEKCSDIQASILARQPGPKPERYILLSKEPPGLRSNPDGSKIRDLEGAAELQADEERRYQEFDIKVVRYNREDRSYNGLRHMLEQISTLLPDVPTPIGLSQEVGYENV